MLSLSQNAVGVPVRIALRDAAGAPVPIPDGATLAVLARPPVGPVATWAATRYGPEADGVLEHTLAAGELPQFGVWTLQARVTLAGGTVYRSEPIDVRVAAALDA